MAKEKIDMNTPLLRCFDSSTKIIKRSGEGDDESKTIRGYFLKFDVLSRVLGGWFKEKIDKEAMSDLDLSSIDIVCLFNHDYNIVLGRNTSGTLRLGYDEVGGWFECDLPNTTWGNDVYESVKREDILSCSFSFTMQDWLWIEDPDEGDVRIIKKFNRIFDVGPVTDPAYLQTEVSARSLDIDKRSYEAMKADSPGGKINCLQLRKRKLDLERNR